MDGPPNVLNYFHKSKLYCLITMKLCTVLQNWHAEETGGAFPRLGVSRRRVATPVRGPAGIDGPHGLPGRADATVVVLLLLFLLVFTLAHGASLAAGAGLPAVVVVVVAARAIVVDALVVLESPALVGVVGVLAAEETPLGLGAAVVVVLVGLVRPRG